MKMNNKYKSEFPKQENFESAEERKWANMIQIIHSADIYWKSLKKWI